MVTEPEKFMRTHLVPIRLHSDKFTDLKPVPFSFYAYSSSCPFHPLQRRQLRPLDCLDYLLQHSLWLRPRFEQRREWQCPAERNRLLRLITDIAHFYLNQRYNKKIEEKKRQK